MQAGPKNQQIKQFLTVIALGILFGLGGVYYLVKQHNPSNQMVVKQVLLTPDTLQNLWYSDYNPKTGKMSRFVLSGIFLDHFDETKGERVKEEVSLRIYSDFFDLIQNDKSLEDPTEAYALFSNQPQAILSIQVKSESQIDSSAVKDNFQVVEIAQNGSFYRVKIHEDSPKGQWAYFQQKHLYKKLLKLIS